MALLPVSGRQYPWRLEFNKTLQPILFYLGAGFYTNLIWIIAQVLSLDKH